jgi:ankyrin repeat protein
MNEIEDIKALFNGEDSNFPIDINKKGFDDWNCLHIAVGEGFIDLVRFFLDMDADLNA